MNTVLLSLKSQSNVKVLQQFIVLLRIRMVIFTSQPLCLVPLKEEQIHLISLLFDHYPTFSYFLILLKQFLVKLSVLSYMPYTTSN